MQIVLLNIEKYSEVTYSIISAQILFAIIDICVHSNNII